MSNLAAILASPKTPLEVRPVHTYIPEPNEILIKNGCIALNAIEAKIVIHDVVPYTPYLAILGSSYGGTIEAIGTSVTDFTVGERVVVSKRFGVQKSKHGAFQRYVVCTDKMISKVPDDVDIAIPASLMMNLTCVVGLFTGRLGLDRPPLSGTSSPNPTRILLYGGSTSFGGLSVQYLSQAGYTVVTTSSPKNRPFVDTLGAETVFDHTEDRDTIVSELLVHGPFHVVVDFVSVQATIAVTAAVLAAQGGGRLYTTQPGREELPEGVQRIFEPYSESLYERKNAELLRWVVDTYLPEGIKSGAIKPFAIEKVKGGLFAINDTLKKVLHGGARYVVDPWEQDVAM